MTTLTSSSLRSPSTHGLDRQTASQGGGGGGSSAQNRERHKIKSYVKSFPHVIRGQGDDIEKYPARYEVLRILGAGASGTVLLVQEIPDPSDTSQQAPMQVTLKITNIGPVDNKSEEALVARTRSLSELHCLMQCRHFAIVEVYENYISSPPKNSDLGTSMNQGSHLGERGLGMSVSSHSFVSMDSVGATGPRVHSTDELIGLIVEYADSGDLRQEIKRRKRKNNPFREYEACLLFLQLLMGVHHLHSNNIIHRDIKSANVLIFSNGLVKLGDFGFAKNFTVDGTEDGFCGTPYYLAAEVWRQEPYGTKVDVFALGVLFHELLTLERPFNGNAVDDVMEAITAGTYDPMPKSLSSDVRRIVKAMLDPNPSKRPSCRQLLRNQYFRMLTSAFKDIVSNSKVMAPTLKQRILADISATKASLTTSPQTTNSKEGQGSTSEIGSQSHLSSSAAPILSSSTPRTEAHAAQASPPSEKQPASSSANPRKQAARAQRDVSKDSTSPPEGKIDNKSSPPGGATSLTYQESFGGGEAKQKWIIEGHPNLPVPAAHPSVRTFVRIVKHGAVHKQSSGGDTWKPRHLSLIVALKEMPAQKCYRVEAATFFMATTEAHAFAVFQALTEPMAVNNPSICCNESLTNSIVCSKVKRFLSCSEVKDNGANTMPYSFALAAQNNAKLVFAAPTETERTSWIATLSKWLAAVKQMPTML